MVVARHPTFASAYVSGLRALLADGSLIDGVHDPLSVGSTFGRQARPTIEISPYAFTISNPLDCLLESAVRQPDPGYLIGQWLWMMRGSDELDSIAYYNSRGRAFSDDGHRLAAAPGARLRTPVDQVRLALSLLRRDPTTRRCRLVLARPQDVEASRRDVSCATDIQFLVRDGRLVAHTSMRSQSALMVLPYDVALFCMLQCWMAAMLGIEPGEHVWIAHSFHLYLDERSLAERLLDDGVRSVAMPAIEDPSEGLADLLAVEHRLMQAVQRNLTDVPAAVMDEHPRGRDLFSAARHTLVALAASRLSDEAVRLRALDALPPTWTNLMAKPSNAAVSRG